MSSLPDKTKRVKKNQSKLCAQCKQVITKCIINLSQVINLFLLCIIIKITTLLFIS